MGLGLDSPIARSPRATATSSLSIRTVLASGSGPTPRRKELDVDWADVERVLYEMLDAPRPGFGLLRLVDGATSEWIPTDEYGDFAEWSPDGVSLFCHVQDEIRVRNTVTGNEVVVASPAKDGVTAYYAAWSMDGSIVYYVARTASNWVINSVTAAGGASTRLVEFDDPTRASTKYGFATDDRTFYMTLGSPESDSFVAELE